MTLTNLLNEDDQALIYLFDNPDTEYEAFIREIVKMRSSTQARNFGLVRDRGSKPSYFQNFLYEETEIDRLIYSLKQCNIWFDSFYLNWLLYETSTKQYEIDHYFSFFLSSISSDLFIELLERNRYECYGVAMSCMVLLEKIYILQYKGDLSTYLFKIAIISCITYIKYFGSVDPIKSAEIYSNYARLFKFFKYDIFGIVKDYVDTGIIEYLYIYGMIKAFNHMPPHPRLIKSEYFQNALMMMTNQTTDHVTRDSLDAKWEQCYKIGFEMSEELYFNLLKEFSNNKYFKSNQKLVEEDYQRFCNEISLKVSENSNSFDIRVLDRYNQIEPYKEFGIVDFPYFRTKIHYKQLITNLGILEEEYKIQQLDNNKARIVIDSYNGYAKFCKPHSPIRNSDEIPTIISLTINLFDNFYLESIDIIGLYLYDFYLDVNRGQVFYGIPGKGRRFIKNAIGSLNRFLFYVGTEYDFTHGFNNLE